MRRRRRTPTRIVKKKSSSDQTLIFENQENKKNKLKGFLYLLFFIIILGAISYFIYFQNESMFQLPEQVTELQSVEKADSVKKEVAPPKTYKRPEFEIQIEVLNGCGEKGIAKIFESYLRQQGFDVVNTENYRLRGKIFWNVEFSKVIDQTGNIDYANEVAESLGIDEEYVSSIDHPSPICDVSVVIGKDFSKIKGFMEFSN